ncbi:MAG: AraC family transcriptional regulator [Firmicutes bacterium]|nr:AraC family transcriptional regulator [Bacillota bacterium]MDD7254197.1 AraC family transcriptional regulator [Bacillota bacterium]
MRKEKESLWKEDRQYVSGNDVQRYQLHNAEWGIIHSPYAMEERVIRLISEGNTEELLHFGEGVDVRSPQLGTMSKNPKKQMEYAAVLAVSFGFRAAINGGVDPYFAYDLNDLFLQRISEADGEEALMSIMEEGMLAAAKEVRKVIRRRESSPYVKKVKNYIRSHLTSHLTLSDISKHIGVSEEYLSRHFRAVTGIGIHSYIMDERIQAAKNLLCEEKLSIEQIANYLDFSSQSHFTAVFRKAVGTTPAIWRKEHKGSNSLKESDFEISIPDTEK